MNYYIGNPAPSVWNVYPEEDYNRIYESIPGVWFDLSDEQRKEIRAQFASARVATFKTRKAARQFVANQGGSFDKHTYGH